MIIDKFEKIYLVTFIEYTSWAKDTVSYRPPDGNYSDIIYLNVPANGLCLKESQLDEYKKFGGGYDSIKCVGQIPVEIVSLIDKKKQ